MNLTIKDRLLLNNQYRILASLYPDDRQYYEKASEILELGFELEYDTLTINIDNSVVTAKECEEVLDVLDMFSSLENSFANLSDKSEINEYHIRFAGFDGNNEVKQLSYATYLKKDGRFADLKNVDSNSHAPLLSVYRRMLVEWYRSDNKYNLSKEDVIRIASARSITTFIRENGDFNEDDNIDELRKMIYQQRGRSETEEAIS